MSDEIIVVEGRDDIAAVRRALDVDVIATHGFGISSQVWDQLQLAYEDRGLIILTDPDHAGEEIRRKLSEKFPKAKQAFLDFSEARRAGKAGIEFARPEDIRKALLAARQLCQQVETEGQDGTKRQGRTACSSPSGGASFGADDMVRYGLIGQADSSKIRRELGRRLRIGNANAKTFVRKLNMFRIGREELEQELEDVRRSFVEKDD